MRYPTCYVLVCDNEDLNGSNSVLQPLQSSAHPAPHGRPLARSVSQFSPPASPCEPGFGLEQHGMKISPLVGSVQGQPDTIPSISNSKSEALGYQLAEKVRQDACIHVTSNKRFVSSLSRCNHVMLLYLFLKSSSCWSSCLSTGYLYTCDLKQKVCVSSVE